VVGWGENVLLLGISRELPWEDLLLDVGVGADFGNLQGHTLVHHLCIQVLALNFLVLVIASGEKLDGVGVGESRKLTLVLRLLQVAPGVLHILIDHSGREILGHGLLQSDIGILSSEGKGISCDYEYLKVLHLGRIPHIVLFDHLVVTDIKLLQQYEVIISAQEVEVKSLQLVATQVQPLKFWDLPQNFH
jgi:hypothetical protein